MSSSFGSANLFGSGTGNNPSPNATSYAPQSQLGLRQRHSSANANNNGSTDENANPNRSRDDNNISTYGKWGSMSNVPAPPRMSLATAGKSTFNARRVTATTTQQQQHQRMEGSVNAESNQLALIRKNGNKEDEEDLSLWVLGYGFRNESQFRVLYHRLESCGTITARRGGLSCFGEGAATDNNDDKGNNWVAVRYESQLCAQKALCQQRNFVTVGDSMVVIDVISLDSDSAAKLGINVNDSSGLSREVVTLSRSQNGDSRGLSSEADILLDEGGRGGRIIDDEEKSGLDSLCGKVLAWFFMWDTQT
mmetsp:Transcript_22264/g.46564  ORF Transcript_22264/g.46564 Transcript_22264/m.46564 type:complete len:307 (-) Transcript_22264:618-1538(-)